MKTKIQYINSPQNKTMKTILISILSLGGVLLLSNCTTVEQPAPRSQTTTTEQTTTSRPFSNTVETQTTRSY
jgi:starvation-inducible outer membrane lipoprotein